MNILSIDTSCDETAAAVTSGTRIISNIVWSQASEHSKFGGVMPSLAQRMHEERMDWVINKALGLEFKDFKGIDAIAVTVGPGLSIALGVGINYAKRYAEKHNLPIIPVNHIEAHLLSPLATSKNITEIKTPSRFYGLVVSGGNTQFIFAEEIGKYKILAETQDDALGEALDKAARMLGFGYPGAPHLELAARKGVEGKFALPIPLVGQENRMIFSYSGLKTSLFRLIEHEKKSDHGFPSRSDIESLAKLFQDVAFKHIERVLEHHFKNIVNVSDTLFFLGGGVAVNIEFKKRIRRLARKFGLKLMIPYNKKLYGDNAAMIGVTAFLKAKKNPTIATHDLKEIDRSPRLRIDSNIE
jgi:N6-L-threonylcarbamoyladenine synthase